MNLAKYLTLCLYSPRTTRLVLRPKLAAVSEFVWILLLSLSLLISKFISSLWLFQWFTFALSLSFAFFLMQFIFVTTFLAYMRLPIEIGVSNSNTTTKISSKTMANSSSSTISNTIRISSIIRTLRINSKFCIRLYLSFSATNLLYLI